MMFFRIFALFWFLQIFLTCCCENSAGPPAVIRISVPEDHHVCLSCGGTDRSDVIWTRRDRDVLVSRQGVHETNRDRQHFLLLRDGGLCVLQLEDEVGGQYHCNRRLVAELQVFTGPDLTVSGGRTLVLPCRSLRPRQRWVHLGTDGRREAIFTRFRNGTVKAERDGGRLRFQDDALQIQDLQPEDAGEYQCNGELQLRVSVLSVHPEPTVVHSSISSRPTSPEEKTDVAESKRKKKTRKALLVVAVGGLGLMMVVVTTVCVLLRCSRKKKTTGAAPSLEDTELQLWTTSKTTTVLITENPSHTRPSSSEDTVHYASLGHHNWTERRTPRDRDHVIYSSVLTD